MPDGTVRGTFSLQAEQPIRDLRTIRDVGLEADEALASVGRRLDELGRKRARATVELVGVDRANLQLSELEARLDRLDRRRATAHVGVGGGFGGGGGGSGGGLPGGFSNYTGGLGQRNRPPTFFSAVGGLPTLGLTAAAATPAINALGGSAIGLLGSAGAGALGAGAVGLGGLGALGIGAGLTFATVRPAVSGLQQLVKAQDAYTLAVQEFGRASSQAADQKRKLDAALASSPPGAAGTARQYSQLRSTYQRTFAPAQAQFYRGAQGVLYNATRALPSLAGGATTATGAVAGAAVGYTGFLAQAEQLRTVNQLAGTFSRELPTAERSLENITRTLGNLAVAATPFFHEANTWVMTWTAGLERSTSNQARVQGEMQTMVNSARDWARLTAAGGRTLKDLFSAGRPSGDSLVVQLTHTLDRWDRWIRDNPQRVQSFFAQAESTTGKIATALAGIGKFIFQIGQTLAPIFDRAMQFISFASSLGPIGATGGLGLLYGAYSGARGALGGRGPTAGGALRSGLTGSPSMTFFGGLGGMGGGGVGRVGGGVIADTAPRSFLMPRASLLPPRTLGQPIPAGVLGGELPLLAAAGGITYAGTIGRAGLASPEGFAARVSGLQASSGLDLAGARYAAPELVASRSYGLSRLAGPLRGAAAGAARFLGPLALLQGVLAGAGAIGQGGSPLHVANAAVSNVASTLTLGGVSPGSFQNVFHSAFGSAPAGASLGNAATAASVAGLGRQAAAVRTPGQLAALQTAIQNVRIQYELPPDQAAKLRAFLANASSTAAQNAGAQASNTWQDSFTAALGRGEKPRRAVDTMLKGMETQIRELGPQGSRAFARSTAEWVGQMEQDDPKLRRPLQRLMGQITDDVNQMNHRTGDSLRDLRDKVFYFNGQIFQGTDTTWAAIRDSLTNKATVAQEKLKGIWATIQSEATDALTSMGFSRQQARSIVTATAQGGQNAAAAQVSVGAKQAGLPATSPLTTQPPAGTHLKKERGGGMISGSGLLDTIRTPDGGLAAPGEAWIANRHTMQALSSATVAKYGKTAWEMIRDEGRPHSAPMRALGGSIAGAISGVGRAVATATGGGGAVARAHPELHPGIAQAVQDVLDRFPLTITSTTSGGHVGGSYHYLGEAADISGADSTMFAASQWIKASGLWHSLTEGIHNPNLAVKNGAMVNGPSFYSAVWAGHRNHIHLAVAGALGAINQLAAGGGGGLPGPGGFSPRNVSIRAPRSGLGGVPGAMADRASVVMAAGMQRHVNNKLATAGPAAATGISAAGFSGGGTASANQALGHRMMLAAGWGEGQWPSLQALWNQESGWNANAVNPSSGAAGIPQALGHGNVFPLGQAAPQIAWGLNYIRQRYGSPAAAEAHEKAFNWYGHGGGPIRWAGWHARGASATVNAPTLFGAGEGGRRERVTVSPTGSSSRGGGHSILVKMENVHLSAEPDQIEHIGRKVAEKILDAIDQVGVGTSDAELVS